LKLRQYALPAEAAQAQQGLTGLTFSKHAKQRLAQRNIDIDDGLIEKINEAISKASEKSIRNALVLSEESAFIVSIDNNVVVTAMNSLEMRENVITNIDGTVIL
jgi:flagellar operon protein